MESELIRKEKEYHELNHQLEERTKELLAEVNNVMKLQENVVHNKHSIEKYLIEDVRRKQRISTANKPKVFFLTPEECKELNLPESACGMGNNALIPFLKANMKKVEIEKDKLITELKEKIEELKQKDFENTKLMEEKEKLLQKSVVNKKCISNLEKQICVLQNKLQEKENENGNLKKNLEQLQRELQLSKSQASQIELKLKKVTDECEKTKCDLKTTKQEEMINREDHKKKIQHLTATMKTIDKHKFELLRGFKKQLKLIENLKKQRTYLISQKQTEADDREFMKLLKWQVVNK